jgi:hypothetical protein
VQLFSFEEETLTGHRMSAKMALFLDITLSSRFTSTIEPDSVRDIPERRCTTLFSLLNRLHKEVSGWL